MLLKLADGGMATGKDVVVNCSKISRAFLEGHVWVAKRSVVNSGWVRSGTRKVA